MQFFPLPVQQGQTFSSAGFDPETRVALSLRGQFTGRKRIDACGALMSRLPMTSAKVAGCRGGSSRPGLRRR